MPGRGRGRPRKAASPQTGSTTGQTTTTEEYPENGFTEEKNSLLSTTLKNLKIKMDDKSRTSKVINDLIKHIKMHLKEKTTCFTNVEELRSGSYYEKMKISGPDEFDVMLSIPVDRVDIKPFGDDGVFYSVALKRGQNPLKQFQQENILSASQMLTKFRKEVKECVEEFQEWTVTRKKAGCPAVTLTTTVNSVTVSLDVVLAIMVKTSWPPFTKEGFKIDGWLGTKVKQKYKREPYYFVPKYKGLGTVEHDGVFARDTWRISFSHVEKDIINNHGSEKTCCEKEGERCCRKDCLKLLKHLLNRLKEENQPSFKDFYSYQTKTTLLHACSSRNKDSDWSASSLSGCFHQLLEDFTGHLEAGVLPNFFIPSQNLLSSINKKKCSELARLIKEERDNGFPIF